MIRQIVTVKQMSLQGSLVRRKARPNQIGGMTTDLIVRESYMFFLQVSASVDLLDSLTSLAGVEADAIKAWLEAGAVTGLEDGAVEVEVLGGIREVVGVEEGGIRLEVAEGAVRVDLGGATIAATAVCFGALLVLLVTAVACALRKGQCKVMKMQITSTWH